MNLIIMAIFIYKYLIRQVSKVPFEPYVILYLYVLCYHFIFKMITVSVHSSGRTCRLRYKVFRTEGTCEQVPLLLVLLL